jgi:hypothetical protein
MTHPAAVRPNPGNSPKTWCRRRVPSADYTDSGADDDNLSGVSGITPLTGRSGVFDAPGPLLGASAHTVDGDVERCADLAHPLIAQASQSLRECSDRDTLY